MILIAFSKKKGLARNSLCMGLCLGPMCLSGSRSEIRTKMNDDKAPDREIERDG